MRKHKQKLKNRLVLTYVYCKTCKIKYYFGKPLIFYLSSDNIYHNNDYDIYGLSIDDIGDSVCELYKSYINIKDEEFMDKGKEKNKFLNNIELIETIQQEEVKE